MRPADCDGYRYGGEKRQPLPQLHAEKYGAHQDLREFVLDLMSFDVVVELGNFAERVGGKEPDLARVRIADANQDDGYVGVASGKSSYGLLIGSAGFGIAVGPRADAADAADEGAIHQNF